jgi:hypothetical protein
MVKVQLNIRVEPYLLELIGHLAEKLSVGNKTALIEQAIKEYCEKNKDQIQSKELLVYLDYLKMETARSHTKLQMRKATFRNNAVRKLKKLLRDGLTQERFEELIFVWCDEAEANGMTRDEFLQSIVEELNKSKGSGINEI